MLRFMYLSVYQGEIHRVKSDGTNRTEFAPAAILGSPVGLALDWITENLYYTNPATQSIEVKRITPRPVKAKAALRRRCPVE